MNEKICRGRLNEQRKEKRKKKKKNCWTSKTKRKRMKKIVIEKVKSRAEE